VTRKKRTPTSSPRMNAWRLKEEEWIRRHSKQSHLKKDAESSELGESFLSSINLIFAAGSRKKKDTAHHHSHLLARYVPTEKTRYLISAKKRGETLILSTHSL